MPRLLFLGLVVLLIVSAVFNAKLFAENKELTTSKQELAREYVTENINNISEAQPALGTDWQVININFLSHDKMVVDYGDGYTQKSIIITYALINHPEVSITNFEDISE